MSLITRPVVRRTVRGVIRGAVRNPADTAVSTFRSKLLSTAIVRGIGSLTPDAIGDTDGNRLTKDFEDLWHPVKAEEMRVEGMRRVEQLIGDSYDVASASVTGSPTVVDNGDGSAAISDLSGTDFLLWNGATSEDVSGRVFIGSIYLKASVLGDIGKTVIVEVKRQTMGTATSSTILAVLTEDYSRVTTNITGAVSNLGARIQVRGASGSTTDKCTIKSPQLEESTGRSDTTTPSEYVSTGVGTGPELWTDSPTTVDAGWTDNGDGSYTCDGTASASVDIMTPEARSGRTFRIDFTVDSYTSGSFAVFIVGAGLRNNIGTVTSAGAYSFIVSVDTSTGISPSNSIQLYSASVFIGTVSNISVKQIDHGANVDGVRYSEYLNGNTVSSNVVTENQGAAIDPATILGYLAEGSALELSGYSADLANWTTVTTAAVVKDAVGLSGAPNEAFTVTDNSATILAYRAKHITIANDSLVHYIVARVAYDAAPSVYPLLFAILSGGTTSQQQGIVLDPSDGTYTEQSSQGAVVSVTRDGDFWNVVQSVTNNTTGNTTIQMRLYPAFNTDGGALGNNAAQGSTVFASWELYKTTWSYSPILTTGGTTKTRLADTGATLDLSNWSDAQGSMEFVLTPHFDGGAGLGLISVQAAALPFNFSSTAGRINMQDGTGVTSVSSAYTTDQSITVKAIWGKGIMRFSVDGVLSAAVAYDGSFNPSGAITLFKSLTLGAAMKDLQIWSVDKGNNWL